MINLGYACINTKLSGLPKSKRITTNRTMIKRTFQQKGIKYASELALANVRDLKKIIQWNEESKTRKIRGRRPGRTACNRELNLNLTDLQALRFFLDELNKND